MTFVAGELAARLRLDGKREFDRGLETSGQAFSGLKQAAAAAGDTVNATLKWAGTAFNTATVAAAALVTKTFATGAAYNAMQQSSRAALSTLLNGAKAANEQMDRLDAFAKTSPFSKQVFIAAQQQMLGFGYSAEQVVPTLDAIQNAVAAIGGSNQTLSEVVMIMSQIKAAGKITGQDLLQFGARGLNAAEMIGEGMGKTGAEIRAAITKGTIGADEALEALTQSMAKKFSGTTAKIKEQWAGAADRIKAATRDIGSALARPFIDPNGGGRAVVWGNQFADLLRAIEKKVPQAMSWFTTKAGPTFRGVSDALVGMKEAVAKLDLSNIDAKLSRMSTYGPGLGVVAGGLAAMGTQHPWLTRLGLSLNPVLGGVLGLVAASPELRSAGLDALAAFKPLLPVVGDLAGVLARGLNAAIPVAADGLRLVAQVAGPVVNLLSQIPTPVLAGAAAFLTLHSATKGWSAEGAPVRRAAEGVAKSLSGLYTQAMDSGVAVTVWGRAMTVAKGAAVGLGTAIKTAFLANPVGIALTVISAAVALWASANADAQAKVEEHKQAVTAFTETLDKGTGAFTQASRSAIASKLVTDDQAKSLKQAGLSAHMFTDAILLQEGAYKTVMTQLTRYQDGILRGTFAEKVAQQQARELGVSYDLMKQAALGSESAQKQLREEFENGVGALGDYDTSVGLAVEGLRKASGAAGEVATYLHEQREVVKAAREEQRLWREAMSQAASAMTDAERRGAKLNDAIAVARDVSRDATERLRALKEALDLITGGTRSAAEEQAALASKTLDLKDAFAQTNDAGEALWQSFIDGSGKINLSTREGIAFQETLVRLNDDMLTAITSAYDLARAAGDDLATAQGKARQAAEPYIAILESQARQAGLTTEQVQGLTAAYLANPELVTTLINDDGTIDQTRQKMIELAAQIDATPDKTITISEPLSPEVVRRLQVLGFTVETLPDGTIRVTASGLDATESAIGWVARERSTTIRVNEVYGQRVATGMSGGITRHAGGLSDYLPSGRVQEFAAGGFPTGIYPGGRPIYKFAEPETGWELFVSGKVSERARNQRLLAEGARRLGMVAIPQGAARATGFAGVQAGSAAVRRGDLNVTVVNPVSRDPIEAIRRAGQEYMAEQMMVGD